MQELDSKIDTATNFLDFIPEEISLHIFGNLDLKSILVAALGFVFLDKITPLR